MPLRDWKLRIRDILDAVSPYLLFTDRGEMVIRFGMVIYSYFLVFFFSTGFWSVSRKASRRSLDWRL